MPNLVFHNLRLLSNPTSTANQFEFHEKLNLITAQDNSVGKSTLVKLLLWAFGCEPAMDTTWAAQDCMAILDFTIDTTRFQVLRQKDLITLKEQSGVKHEFHKITGDYAFTIADLLGFKALLPNRANDVETPPPAYYFLPFYIDQKKSWSSAWENFEGLGQYSNWKSTIVQYHVGLLTPEHFELEKEKANKKFVQKDLEDQVQRFSTTIEVVSSYTPEIKSTISEAKFTEMTDEIRKDLKQLSEEQEKVLSELSVTQSESSYIENQVKILKSCVEELDKDYVFAYENIEGGILECPLCATHHENNIFNKSSILADKTSAENQLNDVVEAHEKLIKKYNNSLKKYETVKSKISEINSKYVLEDSEMGAIKLSDIIENIAGNSIKENVIKAKQQKVEESNGISREITALSKKQKALLTPEQRDEIVKKFVLLFSKYLKELEAVAINLSEINSPLDYNKIVKEGGAAESTRAMLAYYLSIFALIKQAGNEVIAPFLIDTPNQQEQSLGNYDKIIELIFSELATQTQVFMCAMENSLLAPFQENGKVITLTKDKLLNKDSFKEISKQFAEF